MEASGIKLCIQSILHINQKQFKTKKPCHLKQNSK